MNFSQWYTDTADVYRVMTVKSGNLTKHQRSLVETGIPCRIYRDSDPPITMDQTAASVTGTLKMACDNSWDIRSGDEVILHRGDHEDRTFVGEVHQYHEPFGGVWPALEHQEVTLLKKVRVNDV